MRTFSALFIILTVSTLSIQVQASVPAVDLKVNNSTLGNGSLYQSCGSVQGHDMKDAYSVDISFSSTSLGHTIYSLGVYFTNPTELTDFKAGKEVKLASGLLEYYAPTTLEQLPPTRYMAYFTPRWSRKCDVTVKLQDNIVSGSVKDCALLKSATDTTDLPSEIQLSGTFQCIHDHQGIFIKK